MMGCAPDLPIELWTMIFFWASLRDRETSKRIEQICRQWKALVAVSRKQCYKQESNSDGPYMLHPLLDYPLGVSTKIMSGFKNFPRDPIFQEPAVFPPVIAVNGSIQYAEGFVEEVLINHGAVLTLGTVLEHLNKVFTSKPWRQQRGYRWTTMWLKIQEITPRKDLLGQLRVDMGHDSRSCPSEQATVQIEMEREKEHCHDPSPKKRPRPDWVRRAEIWQKIRYADRWLRIGRLPFIL